MKAIPKFFLATSILGLGTIGCGGETGFTDGPIPIERPTEVNILERSLETRDLPADVGPFVRIIHTDSGTLLGGPSGLYALTPDGISRMHPTPVVDLVLYSDVVLVAQTNSISIWGSGTLTESPLTQALGDGELTGLTVRGDALWISTTQGVFEYTGGEITSLMASVDARELHGGRSASYLATEVGDSGNYMAIEPGQDAWQLLDFSESGVTDIRPGGQSLYGLLDGALFQYLTAQDSAVWRRIALTLDAVPETDIEQIITSEDGQLWGMSPQLLFEHTDGSVNQILRADDLDATTLQVDGNGAVWLSDGATIATYFDAPPSTIEISWMGSVAAFAEANCNRCHGVLGTARGLHTQEQWTEEIDNIIQIIEAGTMPADGQALVLGDIALLRAWKDGGLR